MKTERKATKNRLEINGVAWNGNDKLFDIRAIEIIHQQENRVYRDYTSWACGGVEIESPLVYKEP